MCPLCTYLSDFLSASVQLSLLGLWSILCQTFSWKALEGPVGTLSSVRGVHVTPMASYGHRKPPELALFCGVPIPEKLE